jgi:uncharacterized protein DUF1573
MIARAKTMRFMAGCALALSLLCGVALVMSSAHALCIHIVSSRSGHPRAVVDRTTWEFGKVQPGSMLKAGFEVRNEGGQRLILRKLNGDCDCLSTTETEVLIEPGTHRTLVAELDTLKASGPMTVELNYRTNDPQQPLLKLVVVADILD